MESPTRLAKSIIIIIFIFGIVGAGIGLTGFFPIEYLNSELSTDSGNQIAQAITQIFLGLVFFQSVMMAMFTGPTIGGLTGLISGMSLEDRLSAVIVGGVGGFIGFYVMVFVAVVVMAMAMPGGGDGGQTGMQQSTDISQIVQPILKSGLPTGIVGALTGGIGGDL